MSSEDKTPLRMLLVLTLLILASGCGASNGVVRAAVDEVARPDQSLLAAFRLEPSGARRYPLVLYLDGSGCRSVTEVLAYLQPFVRRGWGVLAPEKRGVEPEDSGETCRSEFLATNDREQRVQDGLLLLKSTREKLTRWDGRLVIIGASEGATIAAELAAHADVRALILLGGGGWDQARELEWLRRKELEAAGAPREEVEVALGELRAQMEAVDARPHSLESWLGEPNTHRRWASYLHYAPVNDLVTLDAPIFMANGARDTAVPIESAEAVREAFESRGKRNLTFRRYEDLDHRWRDLAGTNQLQRVAEDLFAWLEQAVPVDGS